MILNNFIDSFKTLLNHGRKKQLNTLLSDTSKFNNLDYNGPITQVTENSVTDISKYNNTLNSISGDLGALFTEIDNIESSLSNTTYLNSNEALKIDLAISDIESKIIQFSNNGFITGINYTDSIVENFNAQTKIEKDKAFYQNGTIPKAFVDQNDGLLKLDIDGEFINSISNNRPSNVFLDRVLGLPITNSTLADNAFDGSSDTYWNEIIHSDNPIYVTQDQYPWLPYDLVNKSGYNGGAACRLKIELSKTTLISELDIEPYNQCSTNLIGVGWTEGTTNYILDPTFSQGLSNSTYWTINSSGYDNVSGGGGSVLSNYGLDSENCLSLYTTISSGIVSATCGQIGVSMSQGLELDFCLKTVGKVPLMITLTYLTSAGVSIKEKSEFLYLDSLGWTRIVLAFDPINNCNNVKVKFTIPVYNRTSQIYISSPKLENIKENIYYKNLSSRTTIFLPTPIEAKTLYLTFSQENYTFQIYSISDISNSIVNGFSRLERKTNISEDILSWNNQINRSKRTSVLNISKNSGLLYSHLSSIKGTQWEMFQKLEEYANNINTSSQKPVFEYEIGVSKIHIRHREYEAVSRYVSLPINVAGEIRQIMLYADDSISAQDTTNQINYSITSNKVDPPEKGNLISNSNYFNADLTNYITPITDITINDYSSWIGTTSFSTVQWPVAPFQSTPQTSEILMTKIGVGAIKDSYIIKNISSTGLDLRGASTISFEWFARVNELYRQASLGLVCSFGISTDGQNWNEFNFNVTYNLNWITDNITNSLVFNKQSFNISELLPAQRNGIKYIRFRLNNNLVYPTTVWLALRRLNLTIGNLSTKTISFIPSDDLPPYGFKSVGINDFVAPVSHISEKYEGTDRNGRLLLNNYSYTNRNRIMKLIYDPQNTSACLSANLGGRLVPYDPNASYPKYLSNSGYVNNLVGYNPIKVTLNFPDGTVATPDILGKPTEGKIQQVTGELLTQASYSLVSQIIQSLNNNTLTSNLTNSGILVYQVMYNILPNSNGLNVQVFWGSSSSGLIQVDPLKISINPSLRTIVINSSPPSGYNLVYANYWKIVGEESPRENFNYPGVTSTLTYLSTGIGGNLVPQSYPVTRNMTDYVYGNKPLLRSANFDSLSSEYYPIYEYYIHPEGYLVFAQDFLPYGDTPATIQVEYQTLNITPRLIINLTRSSFTNTTPYVNSYKLLLNVRRN